MALVVVRDPLSGVGFNSLPDRRCYLYTEDGSQSFAFEFAPSEIQYTLWEDDWSQVSRVGLAPLLVRKAAKLDEMRFSVNLATRGETYGEQFEHLTALRSIAQTRQRVMMRYSEHEAGLWRITACSASSVLRHPDTNRIVRATAELTLTRASDPIPGLGPVSASTTGVVAAASASGARTVTVSRGDTLWGIAARVYGNGALWPRIFDANRSKISNPSLIFPGQVLTIP